MKDIFTARLRAQFAEALGALCDELKLIEGVPPSWEEKFSGPDGPELWLKELRTPLKKKTAPYAKAVQSLTGSPACVFHALSYHDIAAASATSEDIKCAKFEELCQRQEKGSTDEQLLWETISELNRTAYGALKVTPPNVPSKEEIAADIAARRGAPRGEAHGNEAVLSQGAGEMWSQLCQLRNVEKPEDTNLPEKLAELSQHGWKSGDRGASSAEAVRAVFPYLGEAEFASNEWDLIEQASTFASLQAHIPCGMMRGIESVAAELANGVRDGKGLPNMDIASMESIGERVLQNVSSNDMQAFASNIDKLMPLLGSMKLGTQ